MKYTNAALMAACLSLAAGAPSLANDNALEVQSTSANLTFDGASVKTPHPNKVNCDISDRKADTGAIIAGIHHLRSLRQGPGMGPNTCFQVSCSYDSAISWCNDSPEHIVLDSWGMLADAVGDVMAYCSAIINWEFSGHAFYDKWSVKVHGSRC
ncbi:hypothetical protein F5883DRAFT_658098 [Diaporthe sp. PMI_573]|nr:hypothetical protein F5883DRAFT_658098 [Diaporthaceae sp. PMI_573]